MKIVRKTLLVAGISSLLLCNAAFASELEAAVNNQNGQATVQTEVQKETTFKKGTVAVDILNVRGGPSTDTEKLGRLPLGTTVEILSEAEGWYKINFESGTAYVCGEYVRIADGTLTGGQTGNSIVEYAKTLLGAPYAYGGNTPRGFDCSGFVQYVMSNFGIAMPRSSTDQYSIGVRVDKSQLMPGDLVYFKYSAGSYGLNHVGIYVGNGSFIHSPIPGQTVRIDSLAYGYFANYYYGATRVIS